MRKLLLLSSLLWVGCGTASTDPCEGKPGVCIGVHVVGNASGLDQLVFTIASESREAPATPAPVTLPVQIAIFPPAAATGTITLDLDGRAGGAVIAHDSQMVTVPAAPDGHTQITMTLNSGSGDGGGSDAGGVTVMPGVVTVSVGHKQTFTADAPSTWSVQESSCGSIDANGAYTAPDAPATCHVIATAQSGGATGSATVTVVPIHLDLVAGKLGGGGNLDGTGAAARLSSESEEMVSDGTTVYFVDGMSIRAIDRATGKVTTLAGHASVPGLMDGVGGAARFAYPTGLALDGATNLYVADGQNAKIRKIALATGTVSTLTLTGATPLQRPAGLVFLNGALYVVDYTGSTVKKIDLTANTEAVVAGQENMNGFNDGTPLGALFTGPFDLSTNGTNRLFVSERFGERLRSVTFGVSPSVSTVAGSGMAGFKDDVGTMAVMNAPSQSAVLNNILFFQDEQNRILRAVDLATNSVITVAGVQGMFGYQDGPALTALLGGPYSLSPDGNGGLFMEDPGSFTIRRYDLTAKTMSTVAGQPPHLGTDNGIGAAATFSTPGCVAVDGNGIAYVCDNGSLIRKVVLATGEVSVLAGQPTPGKMNGTGAGAQFDGLSGIVIEDANTLYVTEVTNRVVRKVTLPDGTVSTPYGSGALGQMDGSGNTAQFFGPAAIASDHGGHLYVADLNRVRKIDLGSTMVTTVAGSSAGYSNTTLLAAQFNGLTGIAVTDANTLYVTESTSNAAVRKVDLAGNAVSTLAGAGPNMNGAADGPGMNARFSTPLCLAYDGKGALFVCDQYDTGQNSVAGSTIRRIDLASTQVTTYIGKAGQHGVAAGPLPASISAPAGIAFTAIGDLVLVDQNENAVLIAH